MTLKNPLCCCIKRPKTSNDDIGPHLNGIQRLKSRKLKNKNPYVEYLKKLDKIKAVIDNRPPRLYIESILKSQKLVGDFKRIYEIYKENQTILKRFDIIYRTKGIIDSDNNKNARGLCHSHLKSTHNRIDKIENENITLIKRLHNVVQPTITNEYLNNCWKYNLEIMRYQSRYPLILPGLFDNRGITVLEWTESLTNLALFESRSRVFIELSMINGRNLGRIIVLLFDEVVPKTVKNFLQLIRNFQMEKHSEFRNDSNQKTYPNYVGTPLHRIFPSLYIETGDITKGNGIGGQSADGNEFLQENFQISAKYTGTLAMIPNADGYVNSKFLITFKPLPLLDGKRVVFGRIINGLDILKSIEIYGRKHGKPQETIIISNSGVLKRK